ncbi:MAG: hypothetical protein AAFP90_22240, partial [Planctomycetota bacterium]
SRGKSGDEKVEWSDDTAPNGLLWAMARIDPDTIDAALRCSLSMKPPAHQSKRGTLASQVLYPETMHHDDDANVAVMLPQWDQRRGMASIRFDDSEPMLEILAGKNPVLSGRWGVDITLDGQSLQPTTGWTSICDFTDDEVHYLEIEQAFTNGVTLQRQMVVLRDDAAVLLADTVLTNVQATRPAGHGLDHPLRPIDAGSLPAIKLESRLPLASSMNADLATEHWECLLGMPGSDAKTAALGAQAANSGNERSRLKRSLANQQGAIASKTKTNTGTNTTWETESIAKPRALVIPLSLPEWRPPSSTGSGMFVETLTHNDQDTSQNLVCRYSGRGSIYAPLWIDCDRQRIKRERTWRDLTIVDALRIVSIQEARAFRVQSGKDQWVLYRSLIGKRPRTFFGKNLVADFYCGRFDTDDGQLDELITVE